MLEAVTVPEANRPRPGVARGALPPLEPAAVTPAGVR